MQRSENPYKSFVEVFGVFALDGSFRPYRFRTKDGTTVKIDRITDVRPAASTKSGGQGLRYACRAWDQQIFLYHETLPSGEFWFVEAQGEEKSSRG